MIWFASDYHFYHERVIGYCGRPFKDTWEMNAELIRRWNLLVRHDDDVYFLGDFHWSKFEDHKLGIPEISQTVNRLKGNIHLIKGNHDKFLSSNKWMQTGMASVHDSLQIEIGGHTVNLSHYPYRGHEHDHRTSKRQLDDDGNWLLHGHCHHNRPRVTWEGKKMINVSCDVWAFAPVSGDEILEIIEGEEK